MELSETVREGAAREVYEETGARVEVGHLHCVYDLPHAQQVYMIFLAQMQSEIFLAQTSESLEVRLFSQRDIPWDEIAFSSSSFAIARYFEDQKQGLKGLHFGKFDKTQ